ncbi:Ninjurin-1 [Biomphalaria glabrata]|uniref:Ninjurin-1-like n=1 Tax=Biomphalaria glabrata TaxID=6526 RepID=A0A9W3A8R3_BIOGL|nr:ninjurin-1-like [Biomphalaria glabrata]XP_055883646.1 ninjurin-1-like [Biomphalaria glabrata]XP_055883647.1 ninjurin-1-like [Biomphalaria glabrata]KAI8728689.1 ninjurin-1-like [Biomphalaria glabrata]KAI8782022.1 ninjurin-1 [Biomphalaria glabrata]
MSNEKSEIASSETRFSKLHNTETSMTEETMRASSVHPVSREHENNVGVPDDADGVDPLTPESFAPLLSTNQFLVRKMASQALMDVALMMANISQLRTLIYAGPSHMEYYYPLLSLVCLSLAAQLVFAVLIFVIWVRESDQHQRQEHYRMAEAKAVTNPDERARLSNLNRDEEFRTQRLTNHMNYVTMVLVFLITVINMFITGFGIKLDYAETKAPP